MPARDRRVSSFALATAVAIACVGRGARAEGNAPAEALFHDGKTLVSQGRWTDACPKFEESQRLDPGLGTLFQLANCHQHVSRTATAWAEFLEVAAGAKASGQSAREKVARERATELESKLAHLTIVVDDVKSSGLSVLRDGTRVGAGQWSAAIPVDPGAHRVDASAPGKRAWSSVVSVGDGAALAVHVPALLEEPSSVAAAPAAVPLASTAPISTSHSNASGGAVALAEPPNDEPTRSGTGQRIAGGVAFGVGVVGLGLGAVYGVLSKKAHDDAGPHCRTDDRCDARGVSLRDDARRDGTIATVALGVGAGVAITGAVLWLTAPTGSNRIGVAPTLQGARVIGNF